MTQTEALKLALEALKWNWGGEPLPTLELEAITAIEQALALPEQEPVAWMMPDGKTVDKWALQFYGGQVGKPLYTTPPQRTWVGLSDDEIEQGCKESWVTEQAFQSAVWWAEAKLKEKNNG